MMPMWVRCKACKLEKVENVYRTATAEDLSNTRIQIRSRLRDSPDV
jgi:hypothetical protein